MSPKILLKLGSLNIPVDRWTDALAVFDHVYVVTIVEEKEKARDENITYLPLDDGGLSSWISTKLYYLIKRIKGRRTINRVLLFSFRLLNFRKIKTILDLDYTEIYSGYNDFDDSNFITAVLLPYLQKRGLGYTKAYKESRLQYNYIEYLNLNGARKLILNGQENVLFFKAKYPDIQWRKIHIMMGVDEDWRSSRFTKRLPPPKTIRPHQTKHFVILSSSVFSVPSNKRSGARLYYIPLIEELLRLGFRISLHTRKIHPDNEGVDRYRELQHNSASQFSIRPPLDFSSKPVESYDILNRYDFGILHNYIENDDLSKFDSTNIPHRFYEYQLGGVIPILRQGEKPILEKIIREHNCGLIYTSLEDITRVDHRFNFYGPSFKEYMETIYPAVTSRAARRFA